MSEDYDFLDVALFNMELAITRLSMASIHAAEGKLDAAIEEYTRVLEFDPDLYQVYFNRGKLFWRKGEEEKALRDLSRAIDLEPGTAITYIWRGDMLYARGDVNAARRDYIKALQLSPANQEVIRRLRRLRKKE